MLALLTIHIHSNKTMLSTTFRLLILFTLSLILPFRAQDDPNLIDVTTLDRLNAIRFDLDGDGMVDAGLSTADSMAYEAAFGLPRKGSVSCTGDCTGYELMNSLDFRNGSTDASMFSVWAEGSTATNAVTDGWIQIGTPSNPYSGVFEGNGYTISNLYISRQLTSSVGLFGQLREGTIRNLTLEGGVVKGRHNVGSLVGRMEGSGSSITSCYSTVSVTGVKDNVGGLVGSAVGVLTLCYAIGDVVGQPSSRWSCGILGKR